MAEIRGFRGIRYDVGRAGPLDGLIAPPYDVIDDALSKRLHEKSPYNVIRLELNPSQPTDDESDNRYTRAARLLDCWRVEGILAEDPEPAIYPYFQSFDWEGRRFTRRGFMARVRLEPFGDGKIFPHEETLSGPKADRLKLYHATGMNLSQVFGLYPDPENAIAAKIEARIQGIEPQEAVDHLGVAHRMWRLTEPEILQELAALVAPLPVFIADGHHRYETGLRYRDDRAAAGKLTGPEDPANFILMMLVGMSEPGLQVMPTHRLVSGRKGLTTATLCERLAKHFELRTIGVGPEAGKRCWDKVVESGRQDAIGCCAVADGGWVLATLRSRDSMDKLVQDHTAAWKSLGVSILHRLLLDECLASAGKADCRYVHLVGEVLDAVEKKECDLACLVQPASIDHIREIAGGFEKMPPKSTYFYPKLACGLVFHPIR